MRHRKTAITLTVVVLAMTACYEQPPISRFYLAPQHTYKQQGSVREMVIQLEEMKFPDYEGKAEFVSYCAICHSLRYIVTQPNFSRATWTAEVHKMTEKYGAPIDSATSSKIVDYLVAIKGG